MELMDIEEVQTAPKTELVPVAERAALALKSDNAEKHLKELASKHASITVVKDKAGREQAHGAAMELMRARTAVEKASKEARDDATKFSRAVIAEAARLVAIVEPEENRLKAARDAWDQEQARLKAEAEAAERARVLAITERIAAIKNFVMLANNCRTAERVAELQAKLGAIQVDDSFAEFVDEAMFAHAHAVSHLTRVHGEKLDEEARAAAEKAERERIKAEQAAEAARLKAEREEIERQRAEAQKAADDARAKLEEERAELARLRAEVEAKSKPIEQAEPMVTVAAQMADMVAGIGGSDEAFDSQSSPPTEPAPVVAAPVVAAAAPVVTQPAAPVASALVLAVAEFFCTDNKTAARWITERASEIATLRG